MKITTTFWTEEIHHFDNLLYINGNTKEIMFKANLNDVFSTYNFFINIQKFVTSPKVLKTLDALDWNKSDFFQFAIIHENEVVPIKWFDLIVNDKTTISHDIAFNTTLIQKNKFPLSFGKFPMWYFNRNIKIAKNREFNIKSKAYKFISNQVKKNFFS